MTVELGIKEGVGLSRKESSLVMGWPLSPAYVYLTASSNILRNREEVGNPEDLNIKLLLSGRKYIRKSAIS